MNPRPHPTDSSSASSPAHPRNPARPSLHLPEDDGPGPRDQGVIGECIAAAQTREGGTSSPPSWQRPPFAQGNTAAVKHGAWSERAVGSRAIALLEEIEQQAPVWLGAVDSAALRAWAWAETRCDLYREWLVDRPLLREDGTPWPAETALATWERRAAGARTALGFDPRSRAGLGKDTAIAQAVAAESVEAIKAAGRRAMEVEGQ